MFLRSDGGKVSLEAAAAGWVMGADCPAAAQAHRQWSERRPDVAMPRGAAGSRSATPPVVDEGSGEAAQAAANPVGTRRPTRQCRLDRDVPSVILSRPAGFPQCLDHLKT